MSSKYRVTKGFKFHARPQTGAYSCFLRSIFLSSMSASIKKKSKPKSDKVATNNNKQQQTTNNKRPFFLPKINKVFLRPILQNLKGRSVLDKFFFENDPLDEPNQMPPSKKFYLLSKLVKNAKWWSKSSLPLSHSTAKFFPLKKGFKKHNNQIQSNNLSWERVGHGGMGTGDRGWGVGWGPGGGGEAEPGFSV